MTISFKLYSVSKALAQSLLAVIIAKVKSDSSLYLGVLNWHVFIKELVSIGYEGGGRTTSFAKIWRT